MCLAVAELELMTSGRCQNNAVHFGVAQAIKYNDCASALCANDRSFHGAFVYFQDWDAATAYKFFAKVIQQEAKSLTRNYELGPMRTRLGWILFKECPPKCNLGLHVFDLEVRGSNAHGSVG
jgi:hypothetical protein